MDPKKHWECEWLSIYHDINKGDMTNRRTEYFLPSQIYSTTSVATTHFGATSYYTYCHLYLSSSYALACWVIWSFLQPNRHDCKGINWKPASKTAHKISTLPSPHPNGGPFDSPLSPGLGSSSSSDWFSWSITSKIFHPFTHMVVLVNQ